MKSLAMAAALLVSLPLSAATFDVNISGLTYVPNALTIDVGDSVRFQASGLHPLSIATLNISCNGNCLQTFNTPGTYVYSCTTHGGGGMFGTLAVREPPSILVQNGFED